MRRRCSITGLVRGSGGINRVVGGFIIGLDLVEVGGAIRQAGVIEIGDGPGGDQRISPQLSVGVSYIAPDTVACHIAASCRTPLEIQGIPGSNDRNDHAGDLSGSGGILGYS